MEIIADLQIHGPYARACSNKTTIPILEKNAKLKGLDLLGTADFQHPLWNKHLKEHLTEDDKGILWTKNKFPFIWQTEVSLMYSQGGKGRRVHNLIFAPNTDVADQIIEALGKRGRLDYDGRPIFGFSCIELVDMMMGISDKIEIVPAHCMTPWFGLFGSKSGFDSLEECFQERSKRIHAVETGLSADPSMMRRLKFLDGKQIVSFSDAHSFWPTRLGREATIFDLKELSYDNLIKSIRTGVGLKETLEFFPEQGKYHWDGHRACGVSLSPKESQKLGGYCPKCGKPLTIGVEYRIEELADREIGEKAPNTRPYKSLIPLLEIIQIGLGLANPFSKKCWEVYYNFTNKLGSELEILLNTERQKLEEIDRKIADMIIKVRGGHVRYKPGYDGEYGIPIFDPNEKIEETKIDAKKQKSLMDFK